MSFNSIAQLVQYVNDNINTNGVDGISGAELNTALNGIITLMQEHTIAVVLNANTGTIQLNRLVNAFNLKVFAGTRLTDNTLVTDPYPDGYTFDASTGSIAFASTRGSGEIFVIDFYGGTPDPPPSNA